MSKDLLNEREFELVNIIGAKIGANQRELSRLMHLSLGMVNMLIKRLISKGCIRIEQLDKRKVQYILTPKGFSEKMRKSIQYALKTINSLDLIKDQIKTHVVPLYKKGERHFLIYGKSDFAHLTEIVFKDLGFTEYKIEYVEDLNEEKNCVLLICKEEFEEDTSQFKYTVNLIEELARDNNFINPTYTGV